MSPEEKLAMGVIGQAMEDIAAYKKYLESLERGKVISKRKRDEKAAVAAGSLMWLATPARSAWILGHFGIDDSVIRKIPGIEMVAKALLEWRINGFRSETDDEEEYDRLVSSYLFGSEGRTLAKYGKLSKPAVYQMAE